MRDQIISLKSPTQDTQASPIIIISQNVIFLAVLEFYGAGIMVSQILQWSVFPFQTLVRFFASFSFFILSAPHSIVPGSTLKEFVYLSWTYFQGHLKKMFSLRVLQYSQLSSCSLQVVLTPNDQIRINMSKLMPCRLASKEEINFLKSKII